MQSGIGPNGLVDGDRGGGIVHCPMEEVIEVNIVDALRRKVWVMVTNCQLVSRFVQQINSEAEKQLLIN